ncbi:MAG: MerR family transcriptional regulator [Patescibacteria group bacterium]
MKLYTIDQAAKTIGVHPKTLRRWENSGKIIPERTLGNQRRYNSTHLLQLKTIKNNPGPLLLTARRRHFSPWLTYTLISFFVTLFGLFSYWFFTRSPSLASPVIQQAEIAPDIQVALPSVANFLNGRITVGSDTGDLSYLDQKGNFYVKNSALIEGGLHTNNLQFIPSAKPDSQIGKQYVDQLTGNLMYFDGIDWITLNQTASQSANFPSLFDQHDLNLTFGDLAASTSATSVNLTLAGPNSQFKILGGASQDVLTINDDAIYPILISQPTKITGNLYAPKLLDTDNNNYFLDPSAAGLGLSLAGEATISATLTFSKNNEYLTNSIDNYLIFSGGLGINGSTTYGFSADAYLKARQAQVTEELIIDNLKVFDNTIQSTTNGGLKLFDDAGLGITIADGGAITISSTLNGTVPDYVFEPGYNLLSPVDLEAYIFQYHHLPGVPNAAEVKTNGLDLTKMLFALLEKTEENVLYILDLNHRLGLVEEKLLTPTVATEVLATQALSPLTATPIDASAITGLKEAIVALLPLTPGVESSNTPGVEIPSPEASQSAALIQLQTPIATNSGYLSLDGLDAKIGWFSDYLAVLGQTTLTDLKVTNDLNVHSILAGLITLDETGLVTINGNLKITGSVTVAEIKPPLDQTLNINIASSSGILIYSDINEPIATISSQSAVFSRLNILNSGLATISAGTNNTVVSSPKITPQSQIILTFSSDYKPATKYWVTKDVAKKEFTVFLNYPLNSDSSLDWVIIN